MTDDLLRRLAELDRPRPLPAGLHARLERVLSAEAEGMGALAVADGPRPLPQHVRDRLEETLVRVAVLRPLPSSLRSRLERTLVAPNHLWRRVAVAACILFMLGTTAVFLTGEEGTQPRAPLELGAPPGTEPDPLGGSPSGGLPEEPALGFRPTNRTRGPASGVTGSGARSSAGAGGRSAVRGYPAPPYADPGESADTFGELHDPPPREPLRIAVVGGDPAQEAGFHAYLALLNQRGGAGGHRLDVVAAGAAGAIATVNLSSAPVADDAGPPVGTVTPLVESLDVREAALKSNVFGLSSVPERQAHLAVAAALGTGGFGARAVVYTATSGPFSSRVPDALEAALRDRGAVVARVRWDPSAPAPLLPADVAFVSLPTEEARVWLRSAKAAAYAPSSGIWGVWSLADESLLGDMPANVRALAPYEFPAGLELRDLVARSGRSASARSVHGWATAKWLAVSIWSSRADDNAELARALSRPGFESGFSPPLEYRGQTHSRTPEAVVLRPREGRLGTEGRFLRDSRP